MTKLFAFLALFRKGSEVANAEAWKTGQITVNALGAVILAGVEVARAFGVEVPVTEAQSYSIAGGVLGVFNVVMTAISSKRAGLPAKEPQ